MNLELQQMLEKSESKLKTASIDFESGQYDDAVSRAYYAVFHAMSAALLSKKLSFSSHSQVIGAFNKEFIKTEIFPKEFSKYILGLFEDRQSGDYDVCSTMDVETATEAIGRAKLIVNGIKKYLE